MVNVARRQRVHAPGLCREGSLLSVSMELCVPRVAVVEVDGELHAQHDVTGAGRRNSDSNVCLASRQNDMHMQLSCVRVCVRIHMVRQIYMGGPLGFWFGGFEGR